RRVRPTRLIASADDQRLFGCLPDLLQFGGECFELPVVIDGKQRRIFHTRHHAVPLLDEQKFWSRIRVAKRVVEVSRQKQGVNSRTPLVMVSGKKVWRLKFLKSKTSGRR